MYMRVTRLRSSDPATFDPATFSQLTVEVAASIKQLPGRQSVVIGGNRTTGEGCAVST